MKKAQFEVIVDGVTRKKDGTLSLKLGTNEMDSIDTAKIFDFGGKMIWCALAELPFQEGDVNIPDVVPEFRKDKTPSERLRGVIYRFWEQNKKGEEEWELYYKKIMERMIEYYKDKLQ